MYVTDIVWWSYTTYLVVKSRISCKNGGVGTQG